MARRRSAFGALVEGVVPRRRTAAATVALIVHARARTARIVGAPAVHTSKTRDFSRYQEDPVGYSRDVLGVNWWSKQEEVARAVVEHPKVMVKASHGVGKTHLSGGLVGWHFDCFRPSITKTTAPTKHQVDNLTWKEVRLQRRGRDMLPKSSRIQAFLPDGAYDAGHYAAGYTASDANSFQGDHEEYLLLLFEEAVGVDPQFWVAGDGMVTSGKYNRWLSIFNPTSTASEAYQQELTGDWHVITISALEHPNLLAELEGRPRPYPKAVSLDWVETRLKRWCTVIPESDRKATDVCWPPLEHCREHGVAPVWYRPGPLFEGRVLGRWPSQALDAIWSEAAWLAAITPKPELQVEALTHPAEIGVDVARKGDDNTEIHVRRGPVSLHHEAHNGWRTNETAGRVKQLCAEWGQKTGVEAKKVKCKIDDDGVGGGVVDNAGGYAFYGVNAQSEAFEPEHYPRRRDELWFAVADRAIEGRVDFSQIEPEHLPELRRQFLAARWKIDGKGRRVVEPKEETKKRINRSPDGPDSVNLAYAPPPAEPQLEVYTLWK